MVLMLGASLDWLKINHLIYADDIVLISPSAKGLQILLSICTTFGIEFNNKFNLDKCRIMVFSNFQNICVPNFILNNVILCIVTCFINI